MGSEITALGSGIIDRGIGISSFFRDQGSGCNIFVGSGTKLVMLLESRIRNLRTKMGSAMKKHTSLPPWYILKQLLFSISVYILPLFTSNIHTYIKQK